MTEEGVSKLWTKTKLKSGLVSAVLCLSLLLPSIGSCSGITLTDQEYNELMMTLKQVRSQSEQQQANLAQAKSDLAMLQAQLKESESQITLLKSQLAESKDHLTSAAGDLTAANKELTDASKSLKQLERDQERARVQIKVLQFALCLSGGYILLHK